MRVAPFVVPSLPSPSRSGLAPALRAPRSPSGAGRRPRWPVSGRPVQGRGVPSCPVRASHPPEPRRERGRHRRRARRARRGRVPAVPAARPAPGPLLGRGRPRRRPRALALRPAPRPRHAGQVDRCGRWVARRPARPHPPSLARADASRGARRGPRLPRPAGCAGRGRGLGRFLRRDRGRAPSLGALPRHRRHPRRSAICTPGGSRAAASRRCASTPSFAIAKARPSGACRRWSPP